MKYLLIVMLCALGLCVGCKKEETATEAIHTAAKTRDQASTLQVESQQRVKENDAILGGK